MTDLFETISNFRLYLCTYDKARKNILNFHSKKSTEQQKYYWECKRFKTFSIEFFPIKYFGLYGINLSRSFQILVLELELEYWKL